jgi:dTDP-glucose pyrophosphorylase
MKFLIKNGETKTSLFITMAHSVCRANNSWLDTGTNDSLLDATSFIAALKERQDLMVACRDSVSSGL